jgi:hypothetical protein
VNVVPEASNKGHIEESVELAYCPFGLIHASPSQKARRNLPAQRNEMGCTFFEFEIIARCITKKIEPKFKIASCCTFMLSFDAVAKRK